MVSGEGFRRRKLETFNIHVHVAGIGIILEYESLDPQAGGPPPENFCNSTLL